MVSLVWTKIFKQLISVLIPDSKPKFPDLYTLSQSKLLENHINLHSGSYMKQNSIYGSTPSPPGK